MLGNKNLIFLLLVLVGAVGCGSNNDTVVVEDDWPGIGEISIINKGAAAKTLSDTKSFNLDSQIALPKMGKDVSFTLTSVCSRGDLPAESEKQKDFTRIYDFPASDTGPDSLDVIDHIAEELLIYPEHFRSCSFEMIATNQIGSTESSKVEGVRFEADHARRDIRLDYRFTLNYQVLDRESLNNDFTAFLRGGKKIADSQLICFSKKLAKINIHTKKTNEINGVNLRLPKVNNEFSVEHCIISGKIDVDLKEKTITSETFSILNTGVLDSGFQIQVNSFKSLYTNNKDQIPYQESENETFNLFRFHLENTSEYPFNLELKTITQNENAYVVDHLIKTGHTNSGWTANYAPQFTIQPATLEWVSTDEKTTMAFGVISIAPDKSVDIQMQLQPKFLCPSTLTTDKRFKNSEAGFAIAPSTKSDFFQFSLTTENSFKQDVIEHGNIFDALGVKSERKSNLPEGMKLDLNQTPDFQYFFRNQRTHGGKPLTLSFTESAASRASRQTGTNGEPIGDLMNVEYYTFQTYMTPNRIQCVSTIED